MSHFIGSNKYTVGYRTMKKKEEFHGDRFSEACPPLLDRIPVLEFTSSMPLSFIIRYEINAIDLRVVSSPFSYLFHLPSQILNLKTLPKIIYEPPDTHLSWPSLINSIQNSHTRIRPPYPTTAIYCDFKPCG